MKKLIFVFKLLIPVLLITGCVKVAPTPPEYAPELIQNPSTLHDLDIIEVDENFSKGPDPSCNYNFHKLSEQVMWEFACANNANDYGKLSAEEVIENALNSCYPAIAVGAGQEECFNTTYAGQYWENRETCSPLFNYLDFAELGNISSTELTNLTNYLKTVVEYYQPSGTQVGNIDIYWTAWHECETLQLFQNCTYVGGSPIPCHSQWWDGSSDCGLCKDTCEIRGLAIGIQYVRICTPKK